MNVKNLLAGLSGVVFGIGLGVSHMVNPTKVRDFLDLFGTWDPSLMLVMGAAVVVYFVAWRIALARAVPLFDTHFHWPAKAEVLDARLLGGAAVFGVGWGLVGFCPGPAISSLAYLVPQSLVFVLAMIAGSYAAGLSRPGRIALEEPEPATR
jgi:uncharacterized membrane protein YedE/YeeE